MRNLFSILLMMIVTVGILFHDAEARRFGGGRSFGMQRSSSNFSRVQSPAQLSQPATAAGNKWLGPIAGLAAGGLLAYLFMGHGLGSGILSWLAIAGIGFMLWNLFRNKLQPAVSANQYNQMSGTNVHDLNSRFTANRGNATTMPAGFDATEFLRDAKVQFIRLQAAYDAKNLNDLREFTTPEVFGEIQ
ncbi:MAG: TIM44-like domain-containing protein, partial [Gammaproteobacteria bacterium]